MPSIIPQRGYYTQHEKTGQTKIDWMAYRVVTIKAELKKRGLFRTGNKAVLVARLTAAIAAERFVFFTNLPPELRDKIWKYALPGRRVVRVVEDVYRHYHTTPSPVYLTAVRHILLSCKEAYNVVCRRYKVPAPIDVCSQSINCRDDIILPIYLPGRCFPSPPTKHSLIYQHYKTIAFVRQHLQELINRSMRVSRNGKIYEGVKHLLQYTKLQEIVILASKSHSQDITDKWGLDSMSKVQDHNDLKWVNDWSESAPDADSEAFLTLFNKKIDADPELQCLKKVKIFFAKS